MTPRGTTYITVGSHGFYYRETISTPNPGGPRPNPHIGSGRNVTEGNIPTADVSNLVDSSSAALIDRLNERARMANPALVLYLSGVAALVWGISVFTNGITSLRPPLLPDVTIPLDAGRKFNESDEYALLLARYGEPNTLVLTPSRSVPLRAAVYDAAHVRIVFVPNGCVDAYEHDQSQKEKPEGTSANSKLRGSTKSRGSTSVVKAPSCIPRDNGSTIVRYEHAEYSYPLSAEEATGLLDTIARNRNYGIVLLLGGIGSLIGGGFLHRNNKLRRRTRLIYELSEAQRQNHNVVEQSLKHLATCQMIWRVVANSPTYDWKRNAGAASLVSRTPTVVVTSTPPRVESNVAIHCIDLNATKLYFLPDMILYWQSGTFGAIDYDDLAIQQQSIRFIEGAQVPRDARQVDQTWRYVRADGGPDRRFNYNFQIPVMEYGAITLSSSKGLNILLHTSNMEASIAFRHCVMDFQGRRRAKTAPGQSKRPQPEPVLPSRLNAFKVLGLEPRATLDEISEAYHRLAQMYHPDKVAGLAPEFHDIAERRMKEINAAYELLKRSA